jgi:hypothetical protein
VNELAARAEAIETRFAAAKQAVIDWMNAEGAEGRLRTNAQAPGWAEYKVAEADYSRLRAALGEPPQ